MKPGDIFEFRDWGFRRSKPRHEFYDFLLKKWIPVGENTFVCFAHVKNPNWNGRYDHSLFFTDGSCLFHTRVSVTDDFGKKC